MKHLLYLSLTVFLLGCQQHASLVVSQLDLKPQALESGHRYQLLSTSSGFTVNNVNQTNLTPYSVVVTWTTSQPTSTQIRYGFGSVLDKHSVYDITPKTSHRVRLVGLTPASNYNLELLHRVENTTWVSPLNTLQTPANSPTNNGALTVSKPLLDFPVPVGQTYQVQVGWSTNRPSPSQLRYREIGQTTYQHTPYIGARVVGHTMVLNNLKPSKTYEVQAIGLDQYRNVVVSEMEQITLDAAYVDDPQ
jgi:hypothetical protein